MGNQSYASSLGEMKALLTSQRKLGEQWRREMAVLTQTFEAKMRHLTVENRQLKSDLKEMEERLELKIEEAEEAREMNGVYSAKLTRLERKFKKLRDQDEESYIEMTF